MAEEKPPSDKPQRITLNPAIEHDTARPITASKSRTIGTAVEHDQAMPINVTRGTIEVASTVVGPGSPQPGTLGEGLGVLSWVVGGVSGGYGVGQSVGDIPGGLAGAALGGAAAIAAIRWRPAREQTFKFVRWLGDDEQREDDPPPPTGR